MNKFLLCAALAAMLLLAAGPSPENSWAQEKNSGQEKGPGQQGQAVKQLFNGKDLTGWKHVGPGGMTVEDGLI
ncbi:MAG TPA: hypothetical protein VFF42_00645, partial [Candidatus Eremiobacteraceae bacterium]|nr:hypothetical protein [Candidatus Eremiobacteraceae bacterium]